MAAVIWFSAALVLMILEMFGAGFFLACISIGCLAGALAALLSAGIAVSAAVAAVAALLALVFVRPLARSRFMSGRTSITNIDAIIGKEAEVIEKIPANGRGRIKQGGDTWPAVDAQGREHAEGEILRIVARSGGTVTVE